MRGGKRPGAGRPAIGDNKRVQMSCLLAPKTKEWLLQQSAEQGVSTGKIIDVCVESFIELAERESQQ